MKKTAIAATFAMGTLLSVGILAAQPTTGNATPPKKVAVTKMETEKSETKSQEAAESKKGVSTDQAAMQKEAKISMKRARQIALGRVPNGKVESGELERENGKLIYSFDIRNASKRVTEVNVNAVTGKIVDIHHENAAKEAIEKKQEAKEVRKTAPKQSSPPKR
jgi:uncharacterized membrane protein YkoI